MAFHIKTPGTPGLGAYLGQALGTGAASLSEQLVKGLEEKRKAQQEEQFSRDFSAWLAGEMGEAPPADPTPSTEVTEGAEITPPREAVRRRPTPPLTPEQQIKLAVPAIREKRAEERELRKEGRSYIKETTEKGDKARQTINALNTQLASIRAKEVGPLSWGHLAELTGIEALHTPGSVAFKTAGKQLFSGIMDVFGKRILQAEIPIFEGQMAKIGRKDLPNEISVKSMMITPLVAWKKRNIVNELRDKGVSADRIERETNKSLDKYIDDLYQDWHRTLEKAIGKKISGPAIASPEEARSELEIGRDEGKIRMYNAQGEAYDIPRSLADEYEQKYQLRRSQ